MSDETKRPSNVPPAPANGGGADGGKMSRRKLMYVAPAVFSQSIFYSLAGCGKSNPVDFNCFRVPRSGS